MKELIDDLKAVVWKGRRVYLIFDSDTALNPNVLTAERALAETPPACPAGCGNCRGFTSTACPAWPTSPAGAWRASGGAGEPPRLLAAYTANQSGAHEQALEGSSVSGAVVAFMTGRESWEGTPTELHQDLCGQIAIPAPRDWPKAANGLMGKLRRLAPTSAGSTASTSRPTAALTPVAGRWPA